MRTAYIYIYIYVSFRGSNLNLKTCFEVSSFAGQYKGLLWGSFGVFGLFQGKVSPIKIFSSLSFFLGGCRKRKG